MGRHPASPAARSHRLLFEPRGEAVRGRTVVQPQDERSRESVVTPKWQGGHSGNTLSGLLPWGSPCQRHRVTKVNENCASKTQT